MRALTVRQPWAWAIIHGGKSIENRTRNLAGSYRGPVAIHAGLRIDQEALDADLIDSAWRERYGWGPASNGLFEVGIFVGVVDLVDVHVAESSPNWTWCCEPWGEPPGVLLKADGKFTGPKTHLVLENPRSLGFLGDSPIRAKGRLGLWTPPAEVLDELREAL